MDHKSINSHKWKYKGSIKINFLYILAPVRLRFGALEMSVLIVLVAASAQRDHSFSLMSQSVQIRSSMRDAGDVLQRQVSNS